MSQISYKALTQDDIDISRTILHESVPISGTLVSGTYALSSADGRGLNIKSYTHGMFQSVYDYPHASASSNHLFDITAGFSTANSLSASAVTQVSKKVNIYNQMAQVLAGYTTSSTIRRFDGDGDFTAESATDKIDNAIFINFSRLLTKDEIKKGSFSIKLGNGVDYTTPFATTADITDANSTTNYRVNSPAGEYGFLKYTAQAAAMTLSFANAPASPQAITITAADGSSLNFTCHDATTNGAADPPTFSRGGTKHGADNLKTAIEASSLSSKLTVSDVTGTGPFSLTITQKTLGKAGNKSAANNLASVSINGGTAAAAGEFRGGLDADSVGLIYYQAGIAILTSSVFGDNTQIMNNATSSNKDVLSTGSIQDFADRVRHRVSNITFNNTTELNSAIYFCRLKSNEFNYSSNPTYLNSSKIRVKTNPSVVNEYLLPPVSYVTTVGLYSANNELLGVAKLSEPLKKTPTNELTLRVRLDY